MEPCSLSLPRGIAGREQYLREALNFLVRYEWMYNYPVTEILASGLLGQLPVEWWQPLCNLSVADLRKLPRMDCKADWPASLKEVVQTCASLRLPVYDHPLPEASTGSWTHIPDAVRNTLTRGMSHKKDHEVLYLAAYISDRCQRAGVRCVVDMGSGIGYLCEVLHFVYGLRVVGLETDITLVEKARLRHKNLCGAMRVADTGGVRYEACAVNASPEPVLHVLSQVVDEAGAPAPFCLVGLHSCGDLTPSAVKLFHSIPQVTTFVLVTCCYHRMLVDGARECAVKDAVTDVPDGKLEALEALEAERVQKVQLLLRWMLGCGRAGEWSGPVPEEVESLQSLLVLLAGAQSAGVPSEPDRAELAELAAVLLKWLRPGGQLFGPRRPATPEHFFMFPLSDELKALTRCGRGGVDGALTAALWPCQVLRRPLLRLASNETAERWHSKQDSDFRCCGANLVSRTVYDLYAKEYGLPKDGGIKKYLLPRVDSNGALRFAEDGELPVGEDHGHDLLEVLRHRRRLAFLLAALEPLRPLLLAVVGLQTAMQHVCEAVILLDRQAALSAALADYAPAATIVKIGDPAVTPRCFALVAEKAVDTAVDKATKPRPPQTAPSPAVSVPHSASPS